MRSIPRRSAVSAAIGILFLLLGLLAPFAIDPAIQRALGLTFFALIFWSTEPIPIELSSFLLLLLLPLCNLISFEQSFAPFAGKTIWLIFAGMVISLSITETALGDKLAQFSLRYLGRTPFRLLFNLHLLGLVVAILIPSGVVRVLLLMPLGIALADALTDKNNRYLPTAILLSLICSTLYGGFGILTGGVPNLVVAGQFEQVTGREIYWGEWLIWMFPILGLVRTALCFAVIWYLFGRKVDSITSALSPSIDEKISLKDGQRRVLHILFLGMFLWATDTLHHIPPVYIGLGLVILYTLPFFGPLAFERIRQINYPFFFYIAALFSLAAALNASGFNRHFAELVTSMVDINQYGPIGKHLAITYMVVPLNFLMDVAAVAGVLTPVLLDWGQHYQLAEFPIAMSIAQATCQVFLPYQSAPFMVAFSYRRIGMFQLVQAMFLISLLTLLLLSPLNILYWQALGWI